MFNRDRFYELVRENNALLIVSGHLHKNIVYHVNSRGVGYGFLSIVSNSARQIVTGSIGRMTF